MSISTKFGHKLWQIRDENRWSKEKMAAKCGLSSRYYSDLELGKHMPKLDTALRIAAVFDISLDTWKREFK